MARAAQNDGCEIYNNGLARERTPKEMEIELEHRVVLSPFAAKRLNQLLSELIAEYETHYGEFRTRQACVRYVLHPAR